MAQLNFSLGLNRVDPPHKLLVSDNGDCEMSKLQNYICGRKSIEIVPSTEAYNSASLGTDTGMKWVERSYHIRGDDSIAKRTLGFYNGSIYSGDDVAGTWTERVQGFTPGAIPMSATFQVSGNSILYFYTGNDKPQKYDGNDAFQFEETSLDSDIIMGVPHLQKMWYLKKVSSNLSYSTSLTPETISDEVLVGDNAKDSINVAIVRTGDEKFYVFKNNSIWQLFGRTPSTYQFRRVTAQYGLASKRGVLAVGAGIVFLNDSDKELYWFGGTEASIKPITEDTVRLREIMDLTQDSIDNVDMTVHKNYFRFAFQHVDDTDIDAVGSELIYPLNDPRPDELPKWSLIRGTRVGSYTRWTKYGDKDILMTGRSDIGKAMFHEQGNGFDGQPIETIFKTAEVKASENKVAVFDNFIFEGTPSSHNTPVEFRYFMDGRNSIYGSENVIPAGETITKGSLVLQQSSLFRDEITSLVEYRRGMSIAFEVVAQVAGIGLEFQGIAFTAKARYKKRSQLI